MAFLAALSIWRSSSFAINSHGPSHIRQPRPRIMNICCHPYASISIAAVYAPMAGPSFAPGKKQPDGEPALTLIDIQPDPAQTARGDDRLTYSQQNPEDEQLPQGGCPAGTCGHKAPNQEADRERVFHAETVRQSADGHLKKGVTPEERGAEISTLHIGEMEEIYELLRRKRDRKVRAVNVRDDVGNAQEGDDDPFCSTMDNLSRGATMVELCARTSRPVRTGNPRSGTRGRFASGGMFMSRARQQRRTTARLSGPGIRIRQTQQALRT